MKKNDMIKWNGRWLEWMEERERDRERGTLDSRRRIQSIERKKEWSDCQSFILPSQFSPFNNPFESFDEWFWSFHLMIQEWILDEKKEKKKEMGEILWIFTVAFNF